MSSISSLDQKKRGSSESEVLDVILSRWSPRAFSDKAVSRDDLKSLFAAASWAASSYNEQPWRFVVGLKGSETWDKIFKSLVPPNQLWTKTAPVLYASFAKKTFSHNSTPNSCAKHDVGAASANLSLQATSLGLHTHGMAGFNAETLIAELAVPEDFEPIACWAIGYLGDPESLPSNFRDMEVAARTRKNLKEVVFDGWNQALFE